MLSEAIKLAIEKGGYKYGHGIDGDYETDGWSYQEIIDDGIQDKLVLDPLFWQALGKALGWGEEFKDMVCCQCGTHCFGDHDGGRKHFMERPIYLWQHHAMHCHFLNLTGGDTKKFWKDLLAIREQGESVARKESK